VAKYESKKGILQMRAVPKIVASSVVVLIILVVVITFFIDGLIRKGVETAGTHSLGVGVILSKADLSPLDGKIDLYGLKVSNPQGFSTDSLMDVKDVKATVRPSALLGDEITINSIIIKSPSLTIEQSANGTNTKVVLAQIQGEEQKGESPKQEAEKPERTEKQTTYRIKTLRITGATVTFASFLTEKQPITVPLPDIELDNLSNADGTGLTLARVFERVLLEIIRTALREGKGVVPASISNDVVDDIGQFAPDLAGNMMDKAKALLNEAGEKLKEMFGK
jgi:uncharacterized protein involved in outer membrane biogenesis